MSRRAVRSDVVVEVNNRGAFDIFNYHKVRSSFLIWDLFVPPLVRFAPRLGTNSWILRNQIAAAAIFLGQAVPCQPSLHQPVRTRVLFVYQLAARSVEAGCTSCAYLLSSVFLYSRLVCTGHGQESCHPVTENLDPAC